MVDSVKIEAFATSLRGEVIQPGDAAYDEARAIWNGMIDRRPALIAKCRGAADVRRAVDFARTHALPLSVRGGGHNVAGKAIIDDGLVVDLSGMSDVRIDPQARRAWVGPGALLRDFDHEAQAFGLACTGGVHSGTGVAGLTLGGGVGYLARRFGLAADNLVSADVVLADGALVRTSESEHPDLYWALRGGGGNFGIVTSFEFQLHEVGPEVLTAQVYHPFDHGEDVLRFYRDFAAQAPDELACYALILTVPPVPPFPEAYHGTTTVALVACWSGDLDAGEDALAPLASWGDPILAAVQPMPYAMLQQAFDAGTPDGARYYYKSTYVSELSDALVSDISAAVGALPGAFSIVGIEPMGGAINRVARAATAFPHRDTAFNVSAWAGWVDAADDEAMIAWAKGFHAATSPHGTGGVYANYLDVDDQDKLHNAYGENHLRLRRVKATYDPDDVFSANLGLAAESDMQEKGTP